MPDEVPERYGQASPVELLPLGVPQRLIHGSRDELVPPAVGRRYQAAASASGDDATVTVVEGAGHFELVTPQSVAWPAVRAAIGSLLALEPSVS